MRAVLRWAVTLPVIALLLWAGNHAYRGARTGGVLLDTLQTLRIWGGVSSLPPAAEWQARWARLLAARDLEPDNPEIEEFLGLLASRRPDDHGKLLEASSRFARAVELRPISANTWANLAAARYVVGDISGLYETALRNAAALGPANPQVQRVVAFHGLATLDEVGPETRRAVESIVAAGMRRDPEEMLGIAHRRGRLTVACRHLAETPRKVDPRWAKICAVAHGAGERK